MCNKMVLSKACLGSIIAILFIICIDVVQSSDDNKVFCYYTNWSRYREGDGAFLPHNINPNLCTHIIYAYANLDPETLLMKSKNPATDIDQGFYQKVVSLKNRNPGLKVLLALGGWEDSEGSKYSKMVNSATAREKFIRHAVLYLKKYGFDGLDIEWLYPKCWHSVCSRGPASDKESFAKLLRELKSAMIPHGLLLSAAVSRNIDLSRVAYDIPMLSKYLDYIILMTYEYHGFWNKRTNHIAPLYKTPYSGQHSRYVDTTVRFWLSQAIDKSKLIMVIPAFGRSYTLADPKSNGLDALREGPGKAGIYSNDKGLLGYNEICQHINRDKWKVVRDGTYTMGPYATGGDQWVSFDDSSMAQIKSEYVLEKKMGGVAVFSLDFDDFRNACNCESFPILRTINRIIRNIGQDPNCPILGITTKHQSKDYKVFCYYTNWSENRSGNGAFFPHHIDPHLCTHIIYAYANLDSKTLLMKSNIPRLDIDMEFYKKVVSLKKQNRALKILLALGGWNDSGNAKYSKMANSASSRTNFIQHAIKFLKTHEFDGLDIEWMYPRCWQGQCSSGPASDKEAFSNLIKELKSAMRPHGLLLAALVSHNMDVITLAYDIPALSKNLDYIILMTHEYHGHWEERTNHIAPLYKHSSSPSEDTAYVDYTVKYWLSKEVESSKLVIIIPTFGRSFTLLNCNEDQLNAPRKDPGKVGKYTETPGLLSYNEICEHIRIDNWKVIRDSDYTIGPYATLCDQWVGFDDDEMAQIKSEYVIQKRLAGAAVYALDFDDFLNICKCETYPILRTINRILRNKGQDPNCQMLGTPHARRIQGCGFNDRKSLRDRVIRGKIANPGDWPWMAALLLKESSRFFCGAILISQRYILTAAHCLINKNKRDIVVRLGEHDFNDVSEGTTKDFEVLFILNHPRYNRTSKENDIALLKLRQPAAFKEHIWPICLPKESGPAEEEAGYVIGWGSTEITGGKSNVLREMIVSTWVQDECSEAYPGQIFRSMICASDDKANVDTCKGDSGGPFMTETSNSKWTVSGIVSWGHLCAKSGYPGVYTKVYDYMTWITANVFQ